MNLRHKLLPTLISAGLALSGLGMATPSFAGDHHGNHKHHGGGHKHHGGGHHPSPPPPQHHKKHHGDRDLAIGLGVGALVGAIAVASATANQGPHYYPPHPHACREVVTQRRCHTNEWGDYICRNVRFVRHHC